MKQYKLPEAAALLGISVPTLKQWIYAQKVRSFKTGGGHHRIPHHEIERLTGVSNEPKPADIGPVDLGAISGRNKLLGTVTEVRIEGLLAQITLDIGGQAITSIITRGSCESLGLRQGVRAYALIKATEVMIIRG